MSRTATATKPGSRSGAGDSQVPERMVGDLYLDVADLLRDVFSRACASEGLSMPEGRTLRFIARGVRQHRLGDLLACGPSRVTELVHRLERAGLISRNRSTGDRRTHDISVTAEGAIALQRITEILDRDSPLVVNIDGRERLQLERILTKLAAPVPRQAGPATRAVLTLGDER